MLPSHHRELVKVALVGHPGGYSLEDALKVLSDAFSSPPKLVAKRQLLLRVKPMIIPALMVQASKSPEITASFLAYSDETLMAR